MTTEPDEHRVIGYVVTNGGPAELVRDIVDAPSHALTSCGVPEGSMLVCFDHRLTDAPVERIEPWR